MSSALPPPQFYREVRLDANDQPKNYSQGPTCNRPPFASYVLGHTHLLKIDRFAIPLPFAARFA